jgi:hypothetical protein
MPLPHLLRVENTDNLSTCQKKEEPSKTGPIVLGFLIFVVAGSGGVSL